MNQKMPIITWDIDVFIGLLGFHGSESVYSTALSGILDATKQNIWKLK